MSSVYASNTLNSPLRLKQRRTVRVNATSANCSPSCAPIEPQRNVQAKSAAEAAGWPPMAENNRPFMQRLRNLLSPPSQEEEWVKDLRHIGVYVKNEHHAHGMYMSHIAERMALEPPKH